MSVFARLLAIGLGLAIALPPAVSYAAPSPEELNAARDLFRKAVGLEKDQKYQEAYDDFAKVAEIITNPNVHYHMGFTLYHLNRLAESLNQFERAVVTAGPNPTDPDLIAECKKYSDELRERLPRVVVQVPSGVEEVEVKIDDKVIAKTLFGLGFAADPGEHKITATGKGRISFSKSITLEEKGPETSVSIELPIDPNYKPPTDNGGKKDQNTQMSGGSTRGPVPWIIGGAGVAMLAGSGVFMLMRQQTLNDLNGVCANNVCTDPSKQAEYNSGKTYTIVGDILFGAGVLAVAGGIIWIVVVPNHTDEKPANAQVGVGPGSLSFTYRF